MKQVTSGSITKTKMRDGSYQWQGRLSVVENGKRKQMAKLLGVPCDPPTPEERGKRSLPTGKGAKRAVTAFEEWRASIVEEAASGITSPDMTVHEFAKVFAGNARVADDTAANHRAALNHIAKLQIPIAEFDAIAAQEWVNGMVNDGVGPWAVEKAARLLKQVCEWGVDTKQLASNPCKKIVLPKKAKRPVNPLDADALVQMHQRLDVLRTSNRVLADIARLALYTGMREGELCALKWDDIDDADNDMEGVIHVHNTVARSNGPIRIKPCPKNGQRRNIPINSQIRELLTQMRTERLEHVDNLSGVYLFAETATPERFPRSDTICKKWGNVAMGFGIVGIEGMTPHFHDLRHTFATQALLNGIDLATVAGLLGHKDGKVTLEYYSHWLPEKNAEAMEQIGDVIEGANNTDEAA